MVKRVFATLANGTLIAVSRHTKNGVSRTHADVTRVPPEDDDEALTAESCEWSDTQVVNLGQKGMPATSLVLVNGAGRELWVGCGNNIVVLASSTLAVVDEICVFESQRAHVRIMVSDGEHVWSADRRSSQLLQWNVQTRQLTHIFNCDVSDAVGKIICQTMKKDSSENSGADSDDYTEVTSTKDDEEPAQETRDVEEATGSLENLSQGIHVPDYASDHEHDVTGSLANENAEGDSPDEESRTPPVTIPRKGTGLNKRAKSLGEQPVGTYAAGESADSGILASGSFDPRGPPVIEEPQEAAHVQELPNPSGYELVDREEARAAYIQAKLNAPNVPEAAKRCASMKSLGNHLKSMSRGPSLMGSRKRKSQRQAPANSRSSPTKPWTGRPRLRVKMGCANRVTALLLVEGTLWVGRGAGDILTVNVDDERQCSACPYGRVMARLHSDNFVDYTNGQVDDIVHSGGNKVICCRRLEAVRTRESTDEKAAKESSMSSPSRSSDDSFTERYQLVEWEAWGVKEFQQFKTQMEEFNNLVD